MIAAARTGVWALVAIRRLRRDLRDLPVTEVLVAAPPTTGDQRRLGLRVALRVTGARCLERSLLQQRWLATLGTPVDVVIGVVRPTGGFAAHAWLDGEDSCSDGRFTEVMRLPPRGP